MTGLPDEIPEYTDQQLKTYTILQEQRMKERVLNVMLGSFIAVLLFIFFYPSEARVKIVLGVLDGVVAVAIHQIVRHYFQAKMDAKNTDKKVKEHNAKAAARKSAKSQEPPGGQ